jgi:nuclear pore complex protein Nup188
MLNLPYTLDYVSDPTNTQDVSSDTSIDEAFILNTRTFTEIQEIFLQAADTGSDTVGPALLAWGLILRELNIRVEFKKGARQIDAESYNPRSSTDSEIAPTPDPYEQTLEEIKSALDEDPIDLLARRAVNTCQVFQTVAALSLRLGNTSVGLLSNSVTTRMRMYLLDLIKNSTIVGYIPEIIEATLAILTGAENYWDILDSDPIDVDNDPVTMFLQDEVLINALLINARFRYPWEALPFLQIIRALASCSACYGGEEFQSALTFLESIPMFTYTFEEDFNGYETVQEEENANNIRLTQPVFLFEPRLKGFRNFGGQHRPLAVARIDEDFCIPARTCGRIISDSGPKVAFWFHQYHGLKYFGKLLETFLAASDEVDATTHKPVDRDSVSEIIEIIATLLLSIAKSAHENPNSSEDARRILEIASSGLNRNRDIISVIFDIFEEELQNQSACSGSDVPLEVLISCLHFIHAMIPISPGRVWPLMSRTALLGLNRGNGKLPSIVESVELLSGRYGFLISCCRLYESLVEDFASNAIRRRSRAKSSARLNDGDEDLGTGIPDQVLAKILHAFTRYLVDALESSPGWKFTEQSDRQRISELIARTYTRVLEYAYGIETSMDTREEDPAKLNRLLKPGKPTAKKEKSTKIMEPLMPSALLLVDSFLSPSSGTLRFQPLLRSYYDGLQTPDMALLPNHLSLWTAQVNAILAFSKTLLRVSTLLGRPPSQLETQLFKVSSLIARLYVVSDTYQTSVIALFESLIVTASNNTSEPPSLLGHLGPQTAKNFLHVLSNLDRPLSRDENVRNIWDFLSRVVSSRQQWFANYLLTGKTPREALTAKTTGKELASLDKPLLTTALEALSGINELAKTEALPMLKFVTLAQNFWPWTVCNSPKYAAFIKAIADFVGHFKPIQQSTKLEVAIDACHQTRTGAYIAEILAMHLFHARQTGLPSSMTELLPNLSYFTRFAVAVPSYNNSLHALLKQNFEARYPGCTLRDLKRTTLEEHQYGKEYFYDLELADKMLSMTEAWTGRSDNGLRAELANANVNLSLVDTQIVSTWTFFSEDPADHHLGTLPQLEISFDRT